jgi:hypothetical protein
MAVWDDEPLHSSHLIPFPEIPVGSVMCVGGASFSLVASIQTLGGGVEEKGCLEEKEDEQPADPFLWLIPMNGVPGSESPLFTGGYETLICRGAAEGEVELVYLSPDDDLNTSDLEILAGFGVFALPTLCCCCC